MKKEEKNCAFQYYDGMTVVENESLLTLDEAKNMWNEHYKDMVEKAEDGKEIEVAIWINMEDKWSYGETLVHLNGPEVKNGKLWEPKFYDTFKLVTN